VNHSAQQNDLAWMLDSLVEVPHVVYAVVVSTDGLIIQKSTSLPQETAEMLAAGSSSMYATAAGTGRRIGSGPVEQVVIEYHDQSLFIAAAGQHARLAVLCEPAVDMGTVAYEMGRLVIRIGEYLGTEARSTALEGSGQSGTGNGA
jgi:predicted regulator of Ras-like GTPase activity (Roadblock/LC7/MglB family)